MGESCRIAVEDASAEMYGEAPLFVVGGWNVGVKPARFVRASIGLNEDAQLSSMPATGFAQRLPPPPSPGGAGSAINSASTSID